MLQMNINTFHLDNFRETNTEIFAWQESYNDSEGIYRLFSALSIAFLDLDLIRAELNEEFDESSLVNIHDIVDVATK